MANTSLPVRGAWIEMYLLQEMTARNSTSLPVRGAWIEIPDEQRGRRISPVAPRAGSVD